MSTVDKRATDHHHNFAEFSDYSLGITRPVPKHVRVYRVSVELTQSTPQIISNTHQQGLFQFQCQCRSLERNVGELDTLESHSRLLVQYAHSVFLS